MKYWLVMLLYFTACANPNTVTKPIRKEVVQVVYASGKIYPRNHVTIAAKVNGYVQKIWVRNGDVVKAGTPLLLLSNPNSNVNVAIAQANLQLSELSSRTDRNQLNAAWQEVQAAYARYRLDSTNLVRYKNLWEQEITSRVNYDAAQTQADIALQNYRKSLEAYHNLEAKAGTDLSLARQQLALQLNNKGDYLISAPASGRVYDVPVKEGQLLTIGTPAVDFGDAAAFEADLDVDESDIGQVCIGQQVVLNAEAYEGRPIFTTVQEIEPTVVQGTKTTKVKAPLVPDSMRLWSGMSVEANIVISKKKNALVIPVEFLNADGTVTLRKGKKRVPVQTGLRDVQYVEIRSGLDENTELIKP